jgi:hypothetical protein
VREAAAEFALRRARAVVFASAATRLVSRATAVREVLPAESACGAQDITPVVVEPVEPVLALDDVAPAPIEPVLALYDMAPVSIEVAVAALAADDTALIAVVPAVSASALDDIAPTALEPGSGGTSRSTPATAARFSSSPIVE